MAGVRLARAAEHSDAGTTLSRGETPTEQPIPLAPPKKQQPKLPIPEPVPRKVGWAVVGLGALALEEVMPAFREARLSRPVALVSGHPEKARWQRLTRSTPAQSTVTTTAISCLRTKRLKSSTSSYLTRCTPNSRSEAFARASMCPTTGSLGRPTVLKTPLPPSGSFWEPLFHCKFSRI